MTSNAKRQDQPTLWDGSDAQGGSATPALPRPAPPAELSELWSIVDVATYLGVPKQTIYSWRTSGYGPQGFRVGKHVRWRAATVIAWTLEMEQQK